MSTWTCDAVRLHGWLLAALLALAGCLPASDTPKPALRTVALGGGALILTAPRGYCVDADSLRGSSGRVALLASCERLTGVPGIAVEPVVMTVSVLPQAADTPAPTAETLAAAVAPARIENSATVDGMVYGQVMEGGSAVLPGGDPRHWRGARLVAAHLVGLALYAPQGSALAGPGGRDLLRALSAGLRAGQGAPVGATRGSSAGLFPVSN